MKVINKRCKETRILFSQKWGRKIKILIDFYEQNN